VLGAPPTNAPKTSGRIPTGTLATTVFVAASIADTVAVSWLPTKMRAPVGSVAMPSGLLPTGNGTLVTTVFVWAKITATVSSKEFVT